jgi:L-ascorbate metabolism protein UlaG (beta-lactamase superfamily)
VFVVPLGIGSHLRRWGVPAGKVVELDWGESHRVGTLTLTCSEARHFSGRGLVNNRTLWSSWVLTGERTRVFFGGDTGYTPAFRDLGEDAGPFDLTLLPIGAYDTRWPDVHLDPAEAVTAHRDVRGGVLLPIHWATFDLAFHTWSAPAEWLLEAAAEHDVRLALPAPGQRFEVAGDLPTEPWWRESA